LARLGKYDERREGREESAELRGGFAYSVTGFMDRIASSRVREGVMSTKPDP
jgi:hypothetical protein